MLYGANPQASFACTHFSLLQHFLVKNQLCENGFNLIKLVIQFTKTRQNLAFFILKKSTGDDQTMV